MDPSHFSNIFMDDGMKNLLVRECVTLNVSLCTRVSITLNVDHEPPNNEPGEADWEGKKIAWLSA